ncbi:MAG: ATP-dependent RNA helicase HrpA [Acidimicrobiales bacterium]|nr:ATP-dependent RNA helicase HrpA [Acidimicrobiales bacterium]
MDFTAPDLPITTWKDELLAAIRDHQVVVVAGETGSGKSTQLPKYCLELGHGLVGHTQPRRIAARSVAERVAEEVGVELGAEVGYAVRFTDKVGKDTRLKVMTDGILLNELQRDRDLRAYDTIIVDEAHERSLNIDFLLGYLEQLLPRRPELKVIVTSATIDTERFAAHFDLGAGPAPVVEVSGRTYPVDVRYEPPDDDDTVAAATDAVQRLLDEGMGDVLVFQSGEREIRDTAEAVEDLDLPNTEVLPLFARLSAAEQHRVFAPHGGRRVVIATNIAETSLTVPGIRSVVDPGLARISRYNKRTKVQRLPIEAVSQASADQRAGRCGRVAPGVCIRLYEEEDYLERPEFTEPEILRTNLASVILQMTALGLGDVESFPFVEPPDRRHIADGVTLLTELGALQTGRPKHDRRLTELGRRLARLPVDPTLGRMVLEAERNGCVHEVMVIAASLSIQDVRERPTGQEERAGQLHARFKVPGSDFLGILALWDHLRERQRELGSSKFRRECRDEFLHFVRIREWQDVYTQLRQVARSLKLEVNRQPADEVAIHRSLLAGLLANVGNRLDDGPSRSKTNARHSSVPGPRGPGNEFLGPRGGRFAVGRGSVLSRQPPKWVVAAELVETNRLWARTVATVQPQWIEHAAAHLVKRSYGEPFWNQERGSAQVVERVQLRALVLVEGRAVDLDRIDRAQARELFILHALVRGEWDSHHRFVDDNRETIEEVRALEDRARRRDILVDEDVVCDFFDARVPDEVSDVRRFDRWWKDAARDRPHLLDLTVDDLTDDEAEDVDDESFPTVWTSGDVDHEIGYEFEPGAAHDGPVFEIPVAVLNRIPPAPYEWLVPGLRLELITAMIRALPKPVRRNLVPAPDVAAEVHARVSPDDGALRPVLAAELSRRAGVPVEASMWDDAELPSHLRPWFRVTGDEGVLAEGPDLAELERRLRAHVRSTVVAESGTLERDGLTAWSIGTLPKVVTSEVGGLDVEGYPSLIVTGDSVGVRVLASRAEQHALHWNGIRRLLALQLPRPARTLQQAMDSRDLLGLATAPHGTVSAACDDALDAVLDAVMLDEGGPVWDEASFDALLVSVRDRYLDDLERVVRVMAEATPHVDRIRERLHGPAPVEWAESLDDVETQLAHLVFDGMAVTIGADRIGHLPRYLAAVDVRLDKLRDGVRADRERMEVVHRVMAEHAALVTELGLTAALDDIRWMIEELRVQQFAQHLGTEGSVSAQRIRKSLAQVRREAR